MTKRYKMDEAEKELDDLHEALNRVLDAIRLLARSLEDVTDKISTLRSFTKNWKFVAENMNGIKLPDEDEDEVDDG